MWPSPTRQKLGSSKIKRAIVKYGLNNFMIGIIEYCSIDKLIERENFYINTLLPEYNILKIPGSPSRGSG